MENRQVIRRLFDEVLNGGDLALLDELISNDFVEHDAFAGRLPGSQGVKDRISSYREAFPEIRFELEGIISENDQVAVRYRMEGAQAGSFPASDAAGGRVSVTGMDFYRIEDGMIAEHWDCLDEVKIAARPREPQPD